MNCEVPLRPSGRGVDFFLCPGTARSAASKDGTQRGVQVIFGNRRRGHICQTTGREPSSRRSSGRHPRPLGDGSSPASCSTARRIRTAGWSSITCPRRSPRSPASFVVRAVAAPIRTPQSGSRRPCGGGHGPGRASIASQTFAEAPIAATARDTTRTPNTILRVSVSWQLLRTGSLALREKAHDNRKVHR